MSVEEYSDAVYSINLDIEMEMNGLFSRMQEQLQGGVKEISLEGLRASERMTEVFRVSLEKARKMKPPAEARELHSEVLDLYTRGMELGRDLTEAYDYLYAVSGVLDEFSSKGLEAYRVGVMDGDQALLVAALDIDIRSMERYLEDIDLGARLRAQGMSIRLCPTVQVQHLKRWTVASLIVTDIRQRAIPWSRLIALQGRLPATLNLDPGSRWSAVLAWLALALSVAGFWRPWLWLTALLALSGLAALNAGLLRLFLRRGGWPLLFGGAAVHWLYLLYSSAVFAVVAGPRLALQRLGIGGLARP